jgi:hypothetical protein
LEVPNGVVQVAFLTRLLESFEECRREIAEPLWLERVIVRCQPVCLAEMLDGLVEIFEGFAGDSVLPLQEFGTCPEGYSEVPQSVREGWVVGARVPYEVDGGAEEEDRLVEGFEFTVVFGVQEEVTCLSDLYVDSFGEFINEGVG